MRTKSQLQLFVLRTIPVLLLGVFAAELVLAQPREGKDLEISFSGSIQNTTNVNGYRSRNNYFETSEKLINIQFLEYQTFHCVLYL